MRTFIIFSIVLALLFFMIGMVCGARIEYTLMTY